MTDVPLDDIDGSYLTLDARVVKVVATDLMIDAPERHTGDYQFRRALVHDQSDGLTLNFAGDYPGGVTIAGALHASGPVSFTGALHASGRVKTGTPVASHRNDPVAEHDGASAATPSNDCDALSPGRHTLGVNVANGPIANTLALKLGGSVHNVFDEGPGNGVRGVDHAGSPPAGAAPAGPAPGSIFDHAAQSPVAVAPTAATAAAQAAAFPSPDFEITYISGITAAATVGKISYRTWNSDKPATYNATRSTAFKW